MLPFKYRTHRINQIEFRNVFQMAQKDDGVAPLNRQYQMEIEYTGKRYNDEEKGKRVIVKSEITEPGDSCCIYPKFTLKKKNLHQNREFRKGFEGVNNTEVIIRLRIVQQDDKKIGDVPCEEFDVNFLELQYLSKDLSQLNAYNFPLIILSFQQQGLDSQYNAPQPQSGYIDPKGMYFTTLDLFDKINKNKDSVLQSDETFKVMSQNFRYFRMYQVHNIDQQEMSQQIFISKFLKLYEYQNRYNIAKAQKKASMKKIEEHLDVKIKQHQSNIHTKAEFREHIEAIKIRLERKRNLLKDKQAQQEHRYESMQGIQNFIEKKDKQIQNHCTILKQKLTDTLKDRDLSNEITLKVGTIQKCQLTLMQRKTRVINDLYDIFFSEDCQNVYKQLLKLRICYENKKIQPIAKQKDYEKISNALGLVVQLCLHFGAVLNLVYNNHMIFNGKNSLIYNKEPASDFLPSDKISSQLTQHKLYFTQKGESGQLKNSIQYLEENLNKVYKELRQVRQQDGIGLMTGGFGSANSRQEIDHDSEDEEVEIYYPNRIVKLMHKIADFQ